MTNTPDPARISDGYHTMAELYDQRAAYHALWLRTVEDLADTDEWRDNCRVEAVKSHRHADGEECFGGGWFIVSMTVPVPHVVGDRLVGFLHGERAQVAQHYPIAMWDLFDVREVKLAPEWDGHTPIEGNTRLMAYLSALVDMRGGL